VALPLYAAVAVTPDIIAGGMNPPLQISFA
jgi:hypothetical protein